MTKKIWIIIATALAIAILLGAAGIGGTFLYLDYRNRGWLRDAVAAYDKGEWARAKGYLERYLPQDPKNDDLLQKYADACLHLTSDRLGALRDATMAYRQILTYHSERDDVRKELIDLYVRLSAWSTLEYYTLDWLRRDPNNEQFLYYNTLARHRLDRLDDAMRGYETLIANQTERSDVYGNYAGILREKGLENRADEVFAKARASRPQDGRIVADYARFLARKSTWADVQNLLDEALSLSPKDPDVLIAAAQADMLRRQHASAAARLQSAIEAKPEEGPAYLMLAWAYIYQGMTEDAIKALANADPIVRADSPLMLITLADLQLGLSAFDDAKATIDEYSAAYPDQLPIREYFAAKELLVRGEPSEAVKRLATVNQLRPGFSLAQYTLAEAYLASGEIELARSALESYLSKNASDERAQRLMALRFGRPISIESLAVRAEELAAQEKPNIQDLIAISARLLDTATRHEAIAEYGGLVRATLEKAIALDPAESMPYRILADLALLQRKPDLAIAELDKAAERGTNEADLLLLRAAAALGKNDVIGADRYIDDATARTGFGQVEYAQWAAFFAQHDYYDRALAMLDRGIRGIDESEAKVALEVERAILALRHGKLSEAAEWLGAAAPRVAAGTTLRRRLNAARLQLAQTNLATDASQDAEQDAQKIIHSVRLEDPGNTQLSVTDAFLLLRKSPPELDRAQALLESAAAADTIGLGTQWGLATVALRRLDYPRALTHIERALTAAPNIPALRLLEADTLIRTDRLSEAERVVRRILEEKAGDPDASHLLVTCLLRRGAIDDARAAMARFEEIAGNDPVYDTIIRSLRGSLLAARGPDKEAELKLREQVATHPGDIDLLQNLASVVLRQGREDEASALLTKFAEDRNTDPAVWVAVAQWWAGSSSENRWREASTCLTRALLANPNHIPAIRATLAIRLHQGDNLEALGLCNRYLSRNPDDADMLDTKAGLLAQIKGRIREALAAADRAVELDDRPEFKGTRGVILVSMRQYDRALRDLRPYALDTRETPARFDAALAEAYFATNNLVLARQCLENALAKAKAGDIVDAERLRQLQEAIQRKEAAA